MSEQGKLFLTKSNQSCGQTKRGQAGYLTASISLGLGLNFTGYNPRNELEKAPATR